MPSTTQSSSWDQSSRGAGTSAGSAASLRASSRYDAAKAACALVDAAFTKCREPSAHTSTLAKPGVKPDVCEIASTTGEPHLRST